MLRSCTPFFVTLLLAAVASAQMPPAPKPGPELKKLDYFGGNWNCPGEMKPGPMGPGGKMTMAEESKWMDGGFYLVMNTKYDTGAMGKGTGTAYLGYDSDEKKYTYHEFNSQGEPSESKGTVDGDTWTWISDMKSMKGRFTEKIVSPTEYSFKFDMSSDGASWTPVMDGKCTKSK